MSLILIAMGIILTVYGFVMSVITNFNFGPLVIDVSGILAVLCGVFYNRLKVITSKGVGKFIKLFVITLICIELAFVGFLAIYGKTENVTYSEDAVIVLGAGVKGDRVSYALQLRLDKAIEYHKQNPRAPIIVTGGLGFQEIVTEAYAMKKYLVEKGVDQSCIIMEEKATSTAENMRFSKEILDEHFGREYNVVVITNGFHIFRSVYLAKRAGFSEVYHMRTGLQWYNVLPCYLRETMAVVKTFIFD